MRPTAKCLLVILLAGAYVFLEQAILENLLKEGFGKEKMKETYFVIVFSRYEF